MAKLGSIARAAMVAKAELYYRAPMAMAKLYCGAHEASFPL